LFYSGVVDLQFASKRFLWNCERFRFLRWYFEVYGSGEYTCTVYRVHIHFYGLWIWRVYMYCV